MTDNLIKILDLYKTQIISKNECTNMINSLINKDYVNYSSDGIKEEAISSDYEVCIVNNAETIKIPIIDNKAQINNSFRFNDINSDITIKCSDINGNALAGRNVLAENVNDSIHAGAAVYCKDVRGDVRAGAFIKCLNVDGCANVSAGVICENVGGNVHSGSGVKCDRIGGNAHSNAAVQIRR